MNNINFINTPPPEMQRAVYRWHRTTFYAIGLLCVTLMSINGYQLYQINAIGTSKKELRLATQETNLATERIKHLTSLQDQLDKQRTKLNAPKTFQPALYLRTIATTIPQDTCLFTADLHKKGTLQLTGYTQSANSLRTFMQSLGKSPYFAKIELNSLQPENTQNNKLHRFTISAQLQSV